MVRLAQFVGDYVPRILVGDAGLQQATEPAAGVMEQLAEEAEELRWLIAGMIRAMLRLNPGADRSGFDDILRSAGIEDLADYDPGRQGQDAATEKHPDWEGLPGHPDYRPPGWSKTVAECCRDANLVRDLMDPETREKSVAGRCEELIANNLVKEIEGRFVPGLPSEERQRLAIERLKEIGAGGRQGSGSHTGMPGLSGSDRPQIPQTTRRISSPRAGEPTSERTAGRSSPVLTGTFDDGSRAAPVLGWSGAGSIRIRPQGCVRRSKL